jgi:hypothetical protein
MLFWKLIGEVCSESPYFTTCCFGTMLISYLFRWTLFDRYQPMHSQVLLKRRLFQTISSLISFFYSSVTFVWQRRWLRSRSGQEFPIVGSTADDLSSLCQELRLFFTWPRHSCTEWKLDCSLAAGSHAAPSVMPLVSKYFFSNSGRINIFKKHVHHVWVYVCEVEQFFLQLQYGPDHIDYGRRKKT